MTTMQSLSTQRRVMWPRSNVFCNLISDASGLRINIQKWWHIWSAAMGSMCRKS
jgi:hypothetical protein